MTEPSEPRPRAPDAPDDEPEPRAGSGASAVARRRTALGTLAAAGVACWAGAVAIPAARLALGGGSTGGGGGARWLRVARLAELSPGEPKRFAVVGDERDAFTVAKNQPLGSVWLVRDGDAARALSATCPHLGCSIEAGPDKAFGCPCHTSRFSAAGKSEAGPSPRDMDPLAARIVDGWVEVDFRRFRAGTGARVEI